MVRGLARTWQKAKVANVLRGDLTGVRELTIDLRRAGLRLDGLQVAVTTDGPTSLRLVDGTRTKTIELRSSLKT